MLADQVIEPGSLRAVPNGASFGLRMPWYRSLPLSCLEGLEVGIDGERVNPDDLRLSLEGRTYALADLRPLHDEWWHVADPIVVHLPRDLDPGAHELDVTVALRIPYIVESGHPLVMRERCLRTETVSEDA